MGESHCVRQVLKKYENVRLGRSAVKIITSIPFFKILFVYAPYQVQRFPYFFLDLVKNINKHKNIVSQQVSGNKCHIELNIDTDTYRSIL